MVRSGLIGLILLTVWSLSSYSQVNNNVIFKLKAEHRFKCQKDNTSIPSLEALFEKEGIQVEKLFPDHSPLKQKNLNAGWVDISTIYKIQTGSEEERKELIHRLRKDPNIAYAEAEAENQLTYQPNDTANYLQWYLEAVRAFEAWDIEKGDTSVFIAISDTGTDTDHPDLQDDLYKNHADPINGIDDDNDGYVDNFLGWDLGMDDNDVNPETHAGSSHGTNVAGIASASTDNTTQVSGCGFNTRIMTVKIDNAVGQLVAAYSSIVYAADRGAKIINCSWGSYTYTQFGEDIVNYASINRGALIVCGAGNGPFSGPGAGTGIEDRFYPAAFDNAMAIGATDTGDIVKLSSNYGYWLNIFAPGERMWTTTGGGNIGRNGGTSMAAPVVAAAAALIKSQKPGYSNRQIEERILNSGQEIFNVNDPKYAGKLGAGRIDFLNALADTLKPGIRFEKIEFSNGGDDVILSGDSLFIRGEFANYLANSTSGTATLTEMNGLVQTVNDQVNLPALNSLDRHSIDQDPFVFVLNNQIGLNERLEFRLTITSSGYQKIQHFSLIVNNDYLTLSNDEIALTLGSGGSIGYAGPSNSLGIGFSYQNGSSQLYEGSFMVGNSSTYVADAFRGSGGTDADFGSISLMRAISVPPAVEASSATLNDGGISNPARLEITQNNYIYDSTYHEKVVLFNYVIRNISGMDLNNLHAGIIADWDLINYSNNQVFYDDQYKMGVATSTDSSIYIGMMVLSHPTLAKHYALDNVSGGNGGVDPTGGFTTAEKFQVLSNSRDSAGFQSSTGVDILDAISIGPFNLGPDSSISLTYAWIVGDSFIELQEGADSAYSIYSKHPVGLREKRTNTEYTLYPNPVNDQLNIQFSESVNEAISAQIFDLHGRLVFEEVLQTQGSRLHTLQIPSSLKTGVYLLHLKGDKINIQDKFVLSPNY